MQLSTFCIVASAGIFGANANTVDVTPVQKVVTLLQGWLSPYLHNEGTQASQKFSEVLRPLLRSSQNIYKMAASKKPNLANYPFETAWRPQKGGLDGFGFFEAAILCIF